MKYPLEPHKPVIKRDTDIIGISLISALIGAGGMMVSLMGMAFSGIVDEHDKATISAVLMLGFIIPSVICFIKMKFRHLPEQFRVTRQYKKDIKSYKSECASINLEYNRNESEMFVKQLKNRIKR